MRVSTREYTVRVDRPDGTYCQTSAPTLAEAVELSDEILLAAAQLLATATPDAIQARRES